MSNRYFNVLRENEYLSDDGLRILKKIEDLYNEHQAFIADLSCPDCGNTVKDNEKYKNQRGDCEWCDERGDLIEIEICIHRQTR